VIAVRPDISPRAGGQDTGARARARVAERRRSQTRIPRGESFAVHCALVLDAGDSASLTGRWSAATVARTIPVTT
jgi:hypothetical protein